MLARESLLGPVVEVLAPLGWATHGKWNQKETENIVKLARSGTDVLEIDRMVTELWNTHGEVLLRNVAIPLRRYGRNIDYEFQRLQFQRANLVDEAVRCHKNGDYAASTLLTFAQIDGLTRDITGATFFSDSTNDIYLDDFTLAGIASNLPVVRKLFAESIDSTGFHGKLSRHGAAHGRDLSFGTKITSTKALVLMGAMIEYLEGRSVKVAQKRRRERELEASKRSGLDKSGRLKDDRQLDQVYFLALDLDSAIFSEVILPFAQPDTWVEKAHEIIERRGLSRGRFVWGGDSLESYWWFYHVPGNHYLGAAARRSRSGNTSNWHQWRWDNDERPSGSPWEQGGWIKHDGNITLPNWTIKDFPTL